MSCIKFDKRYNTFHLYDNKDKYVRSLGKISKEQALQELELFKRQMEIKPIYRTIVIDPPWPIEKIRRIVADPPLIVEMIKNVWTTRK